MSLASFITDIVTEFKDPIKALIVAGGAVVVHKVSGWFKHKTGIDIDKRVHDVVKSGLNAAKAEIKKRGWDIKVESGAIKARDYAVGVIEKKLKALKLPKFARDVLEEMVEDGLERMKDEMKSAVAKATVTVNNA